MVGHTRDTGGGVWLMCHMALLSGHCEPDDLLPKFANQLTQDKSQWIVAQGPLSALTTPGFI